MLLFLIVSVGKKSSLTKQTDRITYIKVGIMSQMLAHTTSQAAEHVPCILWRWSTTTTI